MFCSPSLHHNVYGLDSLAAAGNGVWMAWGDGVVVGEKLVEW